jgi:elongation factor P--(R)-beta-lysine ligase
MHTAHSGPSQRAGRVSAGRDDRGSPPPGAPGGAATWRRLAEGALSWGALRTRARILEGIRAYFRGHGFLEVDTPVASRYPNIDPNVFPVHIADASGTTARFYLHTSPELAMKKLLAAGSGDIFYLGKVFRDREGSPLHSPEFTMLEWYRAGAAEAVMQDVENLVRSLAGEVRGARSVVRGGKEIPLDRPWERRELAALFEELLACPMTDAVRLRDRLSRRGLRPGPSDGWEDLFFRAYVDVIEPHAESLGACFLGGFPEALGAMARRRESDPRIAERFEGYLGGVEIVNGYEELTDAHEQEARLVALAERHRRSTGEWLPPDPEFLDAVRHGLPRCAGAALGVDRLVMLLLGADDIADGMYR